MKEKKKMVVKFIVMIGHVEDRRFYGYMTRDKAIEVCNLIRTQLPAGSISQEPVFMEEKNEQKIQR